MPCQGPDVPEYSDEHLLHRTKVASYLCEIMQFIERRDTLYEDIKVLYPIIYAWWLEHKRLDQMKRQQEMEREQRQRDKDKALEKLTPHERKLLHLD